MSIEAPKFGDIFSFYGDDRVMYLGDSMGGWVGMDLVSTERIDAGTIAGALCVLTENKWKDLTPPVMTISDIKVRLNALFPAEIQRLYEMLGEKP